MNRKKGLLLGIGILLIGLSLVGVSYASWLFTSKQKDFNTLQSKCFELTMINESEGITLSKAYPISDEEGLDTTGYTFTIKNTCNTYATYQVNLEELLTEEKRLSREYIKVSVNDGSPISLKNLEEQIGHIEEADKSYGLTSGSLAPEEEATYTIKLWMDESTPPLEETMNATFLSKVSIEAGYIEEGKLENTIQIIATSKTEEFSQEKEAFEIVGTSENYNLIEYSFDNTHWTRIENPNKEVTILEEITKEGSYTIYLKDEVGNIQEIPITTNKLDQTIPEISIEVQDKQETIELEIELLDEKSGIKSYAITTNKEEPEEWISYKGKITYTVTENNIYYIWAEDQVGNKTYQVYSASTIDIKAPEVTISNTLTDWGTTDTIQIKATDDVIGISGISISKEEDVYYWEVIENSLSYETEKEITENGTYYISLKDGYEHITTKSIVIDKIDNILPSIESLSASTEWGTKNEITGTVVDNESGLSGYQITKEKTEPSEYLSISGSSYEFTYTATENGIYYIWVKDGVGNLYQTEIEVSKIDNTAPVLSTITNSSNGEWAQSVTLSWDIEETGSGIKSVEWRLNDGTTWTAFSETEQNGTTRTNERNDTIYIRVTDNAGNVSNIESTVLKIDRTNPTVSWSINSSTTGSNSWYKALSLKATLSDSQSGVASAKYCTTTSTTCTPGTTATISNNAFTVTLGSKASAQRVCSEITDTAGNTSGVICSASYKVDTTNPTAKISATASNNTIKVSASGSSDSHSGIANYQYSKDNKTWYTSTSNSYTFTGLSIGSYTVYVKVTDNAGRTSSAVSTTVKVADIASNYITNLANSSSELAYDNTEDNNLRYIGAAPNNYVSFNNELWRIIGVFNNIDDGTGTKETRLKIVRANRIGRYSWDNTGSYGLNNWSDSTLQKVLNEGAYFNRTTGECPYGQNGATTACDFSITGLSEETKNMIGNALWSLGGSSEYEEITASMFYERERGTDVYSGRPTEWIGKVALIYPSDFIYATSGGTTIDRETCLNKELYNWNYSSYADCPDNVWLIEDYGQWTLTPVSDYLGARAFLVDNAGYFEDVYVHNINAIIPTLYLKANIKISGGTGTISNPFILSVN